MPKTVTPFMLKSNKRKKAIEGKKYSFTRDAWRRLKRNRTALVGMCIIILLFLTAIFADFLAPYDPSQADFSAAFQRPSWERPFGTDNIGRDLFSRTIHGTRYSLPIGIACMVTAMAFGGIFGMVSSFFAGKVDIFIMRLMDIIQSIPGTLMAITIVAVLDRGMWQLILAITIAFVPAFSKTVRAAIFTVRNNEYIEACRSIGAGNLRLMMKHMLPNAVGYIIIFAVGVVSASIMTVSMLSYIGLGVRPPNPEWGSLLATGREFLQSYPHMVLFPGLLILITVLAFNLFADGLRDALDPRLK